MSDAGSKFLVFTLQGRLCAFDLSQVAEVMEPPPLFPIPTAPPCYPGAMNFHGDIVTVMDLALFMGLPTCHGNEQVIVLDAGLAALAFLVERVLRIVPADQLEIEEGRERFARARLALPEGKAVLLDAVAIAEQAAETING